MLTNEERKQKRIDRANARADRHEQKSNAAYERSHRATEGIPFGQPILIGHHSQRKHERALDKSHRAIRECVRESDLAKSARHLADRLEDANDISSDSSDAPEELQKKIDYIEGKQAFMKKANNAIRKGKTYDERFTNLKKIDCSDEDARIILGANTLGIVGFPDYKLRNNNAKLKTAKNRLTSLLRERSKPAASLTIGSVSVIDNKDLNRTQIIFPGKPNIEVIHLLKSHGFHWSPTNKAWQRMCSESARYWAKIIAEKYI